MAPQIRVIKPRQYEADALPISRVKSIQPSPATVNLPNSNLSLQNSAAVKPVKPPTSQRLALNDLVLPNSPQLHQKVQLNDQFLININGVNQAFPARYVGSVVVIWRSDLNQFQLLTDPAGNSLSSDRFSTFEHCLSAAVELEQTFAMEEAIVLRSSETWEAIAQVIRQHWHREQVALRLGAA
jgi:hypothetical protein